MMIFKTIDGLFKSTRYGVWALSLLGLVGSLILILANLSLGFYSTLTFVSTLLLCLGLGLILAPSQFKQVEALGQKRWAAGFGMVVCAVVLFGAIYFLNGTFPSYNLLFI